MRTLLEYAHDAMIAGAIYFVLRIVYELTLNIKNVPNIRTSPKIRRAIIERLRHDLESRLGRPYTIVDLGSGNGQLSWHIARALPQATVIGLDISRPGHLRARMRQRLRGPANLSYRCCDFNAYGLDRVDAVVMYLSAGMVVRIQDKLRRELPPGALVISNTFALGGDWVPVETTGFHSVIYIDTALLLYRQQGAIVTG